jgi:hypothetical protein
MESTSGPTEFGIRKKVRLQAYQETPLLTPLLF